MRRQDLHIARQHDDVGTVFCDQTRDLIERWLLVLRIDRHVDERDAMPLDHAAQVVVVGNHAGNVAIQFVAVPAVQQVRQAVGLAAGHQHHAFLLRRVGDAPLHGEFPGDRRKRLIETVQVEGQRIGTDFMAHEKPAALRVRMVARFGDPAVVGRQEVTDLGDDAGAVRAGDYQPKSAHEQLQRISEGAHFSHTNEKLQYLVKAASCRVTGAARA